MGRKGVSKRKKAKAVTVSGKNSTSGGRKVENQPEQVIRKSKP